MEIITNYTDRSEKRESGVVEISLDGEERERHRRSCKKGRDKELIKD